MFERPAGWPKIQAELTTRMIDLSPLYNSAASAPPNRSGEKMRLHHKSFEGHLTKRECLSPVGRLHLVASPKGLRAVLWQSDLDDPECRRQLANIESSSEDPVLESAAHQLGEYFSGQRHRFDVHLDPVGSTFQLKAWRELQQIPFGQTITYRYQAESMGQGQASRAVGTANGKNPLSIFVPCHRVVPKSGGVGGFASGSETKEALLELEKRHAQESDHGMDSTNP